MGPRTTKLLAGLTEIIFLALCFTLLMITMDKVYKKYAYGHSWYDNECCNMLDCAPVDWAIQFDTWFGDGPRIKMVIKVRGVMLEVPENFPMRESKDSRMHACVRQDTSELPKLICLYMPPST